MGVQNKFKESFVWQREIMTTVNPASKVLTELQFSSLVQNQNLLDCCKVE